MNEEIIEKTQSDHVVQLFSQLVAFHFIEVFRLPYSIFIDKNTLSPSFMIFFQKTQSKLSLIWSVHKCGQTSKESEIQDLWRNRLIVFLYNSVQNVCLMMIISIQHFHLYKTKYAC